MSEVIDVKEHLLSAKPFKYLEPHELDMLVAYSRIVSFNPGEVLIQQGKKGRGMYILIEGKALMVARVLGEGSINLAVLNQGDFIGEVSLIERGISTASVIASDQVKCLLVSSTYFSMLSTFFPYVRYKITKGTIEVVVARLKQTCQKIRDIMQETDISPRLAFVTLMKLFYHEHASNLEDAKIDIEILNKYPLIKFVSKEEWEEFLHYTEIVKASKKCVLVKESDKKADFYIVLRGAVQADITHKNKVAKLGVLGPAAFFGNLSSVEDEQSLVSYVACENCVLLKITEEKLNQIKNENILLWYKVYDTIGDAIVGLERFADKFYLRINSELYNR